VSHFVVFVLGLLSGYLLILLQDRRQTSKALSREVYQPIHHLLSRGRARIVASARFDDYSMWEGIRDSGLSNRVTGRVRRNLDALFDDTLRDYDQAWLQFDERMRAAQMQWDELGGPAESGCEIRPINWWAVVAEEDFRWTRAELGPRENTTLGQRYLSSAHLCACGQTLKEFAHTRWLEMWSDPDCVRFRHTRRIALAQLDKSLEVVGSLIRV
jgi:hypothetical protein